VGFYGGGDLDKWGGVDLKWGAWLVTNVGVIIFIGYKHLQYYADEKHQNPQYS
jgi:hypothetical protein